MPARFNNLEHALKGVVFTDFMGMDSLGLRAVAEGVDTEAQLRLVAAEGCDEMQG